MTTGARRRTRVRRVRTGTGLSLTLALAFIAGMTDAIGLLLVGRYVSFMSGNTTEFGTAVVAGNPATLFLIAAVLAVFVLGSALGEVVMHASGRRQAVLLLLVAIPIALPAAVGSLPWGILPAVLGMGMLNAAVDRVGDQPFGITFVTGALARFGKGLGRALCGRAGYSWTFQLVPWLGMLAGAVVGAFLQVRFGAEALIAPAIAALVLAGLTILIPRRWRRRLSSG